jgi:hypothetical protein
LPPATALPPAAPQYLYLSEGNALMTKRSTSADYVTAFATGWPENQPEIMVLSLTTHKGVQDFALSKEQALLIAKTMKDTAARLARPKQGG